MRSQSHALLVFWKKFQVASSHVHYFENKTTLKIRKVMSPVLISFRKKFRLQVPMYILLNTGTFFLELKNQALKTSPHKKTVCQKNRLWMIQQTSKHSLQNDRNTKTDKKNRIQSYHNRLRKRSHFLFSFGKCFRLQAQLLFTLKT